MKMKKEIMSMYRACRKSGKNISKGGKSVLVSDRWNEQIFECSIPALIEWVRIEKIEKYRIRMNGFRQIHFQWF